MNLNFLTVDRAFNAKRDSKVNYIKENNNLLLIDCGENTLQKLLSKYILIDIKVVDILITCTHPDSIAGLGNLILYLYNVKNIKTNIIYGNRYEDITILTTFMAIQNTLLYCDIINVDNYKSCNDYTVKAILLKDSNNITSYAYTIKDNTETLLYTSGSLDYFLNNNIKLS